MQLRNSAIAAMTGKIFINYRRLESLRDADHLHTRLLRHFSAKSLFIDRHGIEGGKDWLHELERQVASSDAMLVLIGSDWVGSLRRIDDETDFVRFEIAEALRRNISILPVLIDGAQMPRPEQLPPNLLLLTRPQAMLLRLESFKEDADRIAAALKDLLKLRRPRGVPYWAAGVVAMLMLAVGTLAGPYVLARLGLLPTGEEAARRVPRDGETPPPKQCPNDVDAAVAKFKVLQASNTQFEAKAKRVLEVVDDFDANRKDCGLAVAGVKSFIDSDSPQITANLFTLQQLSGCVFLLRNNSEGLYRQKICRKPRISVPIRWDLRAAELCPTRRVQFSRAAPSRPFLSC